MLENIEKELLNIIQTDFPVEERPYKKIGEQLGISENEAFETTKKLFDKGVIRRLGATFDSKKLNYASTLCAAHVEDEKIDDFVEVVNGYTGVTHNYLRKDYYNIWFTFIGKSEKFIEEKLKEIAEKTGVNEIVNFPAKKMFKVKVNLNV